VVSNAITISGHTLKPGPTCLVCDRNFSEVGGRRIVVQLRRGISFVETRVAPSQRDIRYFGHARLEDDPDRYLMLWGDSHHWTSSLLDKAAGQARDNQRPWFCQVCGYRACSYCATPYIYPLACDCVHEDGEVGHCGGLPVAIHCINKDCPRYYPGGGGRWSAL